MNRLFNKYHKVKKRTQFGEIEVADSYWEGVFDDLTGLAAETCQTPIALLTMTDGKSLLIESNVGLDRARVKRYIAFCNQVMQQSGSSQSHLMIITNALEDRRFTASDLVRDEPRIEFYAGVNLVTSAGVNLGVLAVMDYVKRELKVEQKDILRSLSRQAIDKIIDLDKNLIPLEDTISKQQKAKEALRQSDEWVRFLAENYTDIISRHTSEGICLYVSPACRSLLGYTPEELLGQSPYKLFHPEDLPAIVKAHSALNQVDTYTLSYRICKADGNYIWVETTCHSLKDTNTNNLIEIHAISRDISDRKQGEEERLKLLVREQAARAEAEAARNQIANILESITDGFFSLDNEWRFTYLNARIEQILFQTKEELIGKSIWQEFPELIGSIFETEYHRSASQKVTAHFEAFYPTLGIWCEVRTYPYQEGLSVYLRDVTERKQVEAELLERSRLSALEARVGATLGGSGSLDTILHNCVEVIVHHIQATNAAIWTFNNQTNVLELQALAKGNLKYCSVCLTNDINNQDPFSHPQQLLDGSLIGYVAQTHQTYLTQYSGQRLKGGFESRIYSGQLAESCSVIPNSYFGGYPLVLEDRLVGVMAVESTQPFSEAAHEMLGWVASAIGMAIDRAWAKVALLSRREALLFRLASQIRNSLDLDTILATAVNEIRSLLKIDRCYFLWCWPSVIRPSMTITHESCANSNIKSLMGDYSSPYVKSLIEKVQKLEPIRIDDVETDSNLEAHKQELINNLGIRSQLVLPLKTNTGQLGAIVCSHAFGDRYWTDSEVELLQAVVDQLAIALDQAEHYAQTRATARAAQTQAEQLQITLQHLKQTQSQLIQTEKMSSLGQMVAGIAHEINNPVNFITGNLTHTNSYIQELLGLIELYENYYPNPDRQIIERREEVDLDFIAEDLPKILSSMKMGAERIRQIVLSLRNFSRLDEAEKKPVDIHDGIDNTLLILQHRLKANSSLLEIEIIKEYGNLPLVECYACQLNQVFMNILSNAIDAIENQPGSRIIKIHTQLVDDSESELTTNNFTNSKSVLIRIADNGPGMTEEVKKCLFDPFFTTKPVGKGTGLGLSISYQIVVDKHGGLLKCNSEVGKGSEFLIQIPLQQ